MLKKQIFEQNKWTRNEVLVHPLIFLVGLLIEDVLQETTQMWVLVECLLQLLLELNH
jgi:hypothetical protein